VSKFQILKVGPEEAPQVMDLVSRLLRELGEEGDETGDLDVPEMTAAWKASSEHHGADLVRPYRCGLWLYVEQAVASMTDRPYRQRVYCVSEGETGVFESAVFTLQEPEKVVGARRDAEPLKALTPEDLELREGCTVFLKYDGEGSFVGGTEGNGCLSGLRGATYATCEVMVMPGRIESWDRGFDKEGAQVWGSEKGSYVFLRGNEVTD
jgi:hypothetical protein